MDRTSVGENSRDDTHAVINNYLTLEDIRRRKEDLKVDIRKDSAEFTSLWNQLFTPQKNISKGELISSVLSYSINAIDVFLLIRKLKRRYGGLLRLGRKRR